MRFTLLYLREIAGGFLEFVQLLGELFKREQPQENILTMHSIQSPEQMIIGRWYEIEVIEEDYQLHRRRVQFRRWRLRERLGKGEIQVVAWRRGKLGNRVRYCFYWKCLVGLKEAHVS